MTKKKTKYRTTITKKNGTYWGNFESDDGMTTVISNRKNGSGRARLKKIRKKRIGVK